MAPVLLLSLGIVPVIPLPGVLPMREQWHQACRALENGDAPEAVALFREFETWYAQEPAAKDPSFSEMRMRLFGLACLQAGFLEDGVDSLEKWLAENSGPGPNRAFIRFQVAHACLSLGRTGESIEHWSRFLEQHGDLQESILVRWMWSDVELANGHPEKALAHLEAILQHSKSGSTCRALARAGSAMIQLRCGNWEAAAEILKTAPPDQSMIFSLWRSLMAPSIVQSCLQSDRGKDALAACRWLNSADGLKDALQAIRATFRSNERKSRRDASMRRILWNKHWDHQLGRLGANLGQSGEEIDNTLLYTLKLEALLECGEALKCSFLARAIVESGSLCHPRLRARAYTSAIRAHHQLKNWEKARGFADAFIAQYPDDPAIPDILMLNARTAAGQRQYASALKQIQQLIDHWPAHTAHRSWRLLKGQWLLDSNNGKEAFHVFTRLQDEATASWIPFLQFQQARCLECLRQPDHAITTYTSVTKHPRATENLVELSMTALLKIYLQRLDPTNFLRTLAAYRRDYPQGWNRPVVENLAGSFHAATGDQEKAIRCYTEVASMDHPAAAWAHGQLSQLYRKYGDIDNLRRHALEWIRQAGNSSGTLPGIPFLDCRIYQDATGKAALGQADLPVLLEAIDAGSNKVPPSAALWVLASLWEVYRPRLVDSPPEILSWCEARANNHFLHDRLAAFAAYQLFAADLLEEEGRPDSADARRIRILQAGNPDTLPEASLFVISRTADRYDFPEARSLLESFLEKFPESQYRPEVLYPLALRLSATDESARAFGFLQEILSDWKDSPVHVPAGLELARWLVRDARFPEAHKVTGALLELASLQPGDSAAVLLLRARADFQMREFDRGALSCARILNLYPDFNHISEAARHLLHEHEANITHPEHRKFIQSLGHSPVGRTDPRSYRGPRPGILGPVPFRHGLPGPSGRSGGWNALSPVG